MFTTKIKSAIVAGTLALGAIAATSGTASAHGSGHVQIGGPNFSIGFGSHGHFHDWDRPRVRANRCNPRKALRKARRNGVRRAYVRRVGHRGVVIAGRKWGDRVIIGFGRQRSCPVRFVRHR